MIYNKKQLEDFAKKVYFNKCSLIYATADWQFFYKKEDADKYGDRRKVEVFELKKATKKKETKSESDQMISKESI